VAGVAETTPVAVTVTSPIGKSAGSVTLTEISPSAFAVVGNGSTMPGTVTSTVSFAANPVPVTVVLPPGATVAGSSSITVS
jgi:hypothetical protein